MDQLPEGLPAPLVRAQQRPALLLQVNIIDNKLASYK